MSLSRSLIIRDIPALGVPLRLSIPTAIFLHLEKHVQNGNIWDSAYLTQEDDVPCGVAAPSEPCIWDSDSEHEGKPANAKLENDEQPANENEGATASLPVGATKWPKLLDEIIARAKTEYAKAPKVETKWALDDSLMRGLAAIPALKEYCTEVIPHSQIGCSSSTGRGPLWGNLRFDSEYCWSLCVSLLELGLNTYGIMLRSSLVLLGITLG